MEKQERGGEAEGVGHGGKVREYGRQNKRDGGVRGMERETKRSKWGKERPRKRRKGAKEALRAAAFIHRYQNLQAKTPPASWPPPP